jgi:hypothetical protein
MRRIILAALWSGAAAAALAQVGAPQLGWVPDGARIRPVYGIPAAAAVGAPIPADQEFSRIAVSPSRNYVLVSAADTGSVSIYTTEHGRMPLDGAGSAPDLVVLSPRGSAAALWFSSINQVQVVTGLPDAPAIRQLDVSFLGLLMGTAPGALAVSDNGNWLAGVWPDGVYAFGPYGEVNRLPVENVTALAFFQGTQDLAAAGAAGLQMVTGISGFAVASSLLASADSSLQPVAVAATSDNRTLVLADHSGSVTAIDIGSGAATASDCGCLPEGLFGMGPAAFRLTGLDGGAFKLFDVAHGEILFAPLALDVALTEGAAKSEGAVQ